MCKEKVRNALRKMKAGKATGLDLTTAEFLTEGGKGAWWTDSMGSLIYV